MALAPDTLPDDIEALKTLLVEERRKNAHLLEQLNLLLSKRFGPSSEKLPADQLRLFNEAEQDASEADDAATQADTVTVAGHQRTKRGRKPLPDYLPRVEILHDLADEDKLCPCGCGAMVKIGEDVSEQLDVIPAKVQVLRHIRPRYACRDCGEGGVRQAPMPAQPIPKSLAAPGLLAHVATAKYVDALPLYRQEAILQRAGIELPRATLANWMVRSGELIQPLMNLLRDHLLAYDILQMDETTVQVLREPGRAAQSQSYLWVQRGGPPDKPVILYDYDPSRGQAVPERLLGGFAGFLQSDGYDGYHGVARSPHITAVGCWAHARRKFDEAVKAQGKKGKPKAGRATHGLGFIQKLYRIERLYQDATPEARHAARSQQARPLLDEMRTWLETSLPQVPEQSAVGKALGYLANQWDRLVRYLDDGRINIDNNACENAIRPFVVGRKNWLFSNTPKGVTASAHLYSLIETAKANGLEPYAYLRYVFTQLPAAQTVTNFEALLPFNLTSDQIRLL
ncbi:MAG: IS66 family transposase [Anaerolineae bacterium]|nr:IS66 family transposase [Anaerolineae bacterium]